MQNQSDKLSGLLPPEVVDAISGHSAAASVGYVQKLPEREKIFAMNAYAKGLSTMWYFFMAMALVCLLASAGIGMFCSFRTGFHWLPTDYPRSAPP